MTDDSTSRELIVRGTEAPASRGALEVLYVDDDAAVRESTRAMMEEQRLDLSVAGVGTIADALEVAATTPPTCLVIDPEGLSDIDPLLRELEAPVIVYTERETVQLDDQLAETMWTVVAKGPENRGAFLAAKVVSTVDTPTPRSEYALKQALSDIASRAETEPRPTRPA